MSEIAYKTYFIFRYVLLKLLLIVEFLIFLRFALKFFGAGVEALAVRIVFQVTDPLVFPFRGIFSDFRWGDYWLETASLSALAGYLVFVFLVITFLKIFIHENRVNY